MMTMKKGNDGKQGGVMRMIMKILMIGCKYPIIGMICENF